jgi:hypothetical protein
MVNLILSFFAKAFANVVDAWRKDRALRQDGANEADLKGRERADEIATNISDDRNNDRVRERVKEKYYRD